MQKVPRILYERGTNDDPKVSQSSYDESINDTNDRNEERPTLLLVSVVSVCSDHHPHLHLRNGHYAFDINQTI